jgi:non-heme chloroperoxidase
MILEIIKRTPLWVWPLLALLIALGLMQARDRELSRLRLLALPLAMVALSLAATLNAFGVAAMAYIAWAAGGTLALVIGLGAGAEPAKSGKDPSLYKVAGSWVPLIVILGIFLVRYGVAATLAIAPGVGTAPAFQAGAGLLYGAFSGLLLSRALAVLGLSRGRVVSRWLAGVGALPMLFVGGAVALLAWPVPAEDDKSTRPSQELDAYIRTAPRAEPAEAQYFTARDGAKRLYRQYDGSGPDVLVMLHGSANDSAYLALFARRMASETGITVVTPDMRGHGPAPVRRGDVDYVEQQEHDLADLIGALRGARPGRVLAGGHSLGGGLAIRYAAGRETPRPDGLILLAPFVGQGSPAAREEAGGWTTPFVTRFIAIGLLHNLGIGAFDGVPVLRFRQPASGRTGTETTVYSWRLFASTTPRPDWRREIASLPCPVLVIGAAEDPFFRSEGYPEVFQLAKHATVQIVPSFSHFHLVTEEDVIRRIAAWLKSGQ